MRFKSVMRYAPSERKFRFARIMWERGTVGDGQGYSAKLSLFAQPTLATFERDSEGWRVILLGIGASLRRSWGGVFA